MLLTQGPQGLGGAGAVLAEGVVEPGGQGGHVVPVLQVGDEALGGQVREALGEVHHVHPVRPGFPKPTGALVGSGQASHRQVQELPRSVGEGEGHGPGRERPGRLRRLAQEGLMAHMDPVEHAQGQDRSRFFAGFAHKTILNTGAQRAAPGDLPPCPRPGRCRRSRAAPGRRAVCRCRAGP